jgi:hypothetical protein
MPGGKLLVEAFLQRIFRNPMLKRPIVLHPSGFVRRLPRPNQEIVAFASQGVKKGVVSRSYISFEIYWRGLFEFALASLRAVPIKSGDNGVRVITWGGHDWTPAIAQAGHMTAPSNGDSCNKPLLTGPMVWTRRPRGKVVARTLTWNKGGCLGLLRKSGEAISDHAASLSKCAGLK